MAWMKLQILIMIYIKCHFLCQFYMSYWPEMCRITTIMYSLIIYHDVRYLFYLYFAVYDGILTSKSTKSILQDHDDQFDVRMRNDFKSDFRLSCLPSESDLSFGLSIASRSLVVRASYFFSQGTVSQAPSIHQS